MAEVEGEWERIYESDKTTLVMGVPLMKYDFFTFKKI